MDYYHHNNNMGSPSCTTLRKHLCPFPGCVRSYAHNHFYQPKTLTASGDAKYVHLFAVVMSFVRLNQAPVRHTPATSVLREKAEGKAFCFLAEFIISPLFPIFSHHFSISHFPFLSQITAINQVRV